MQRPEDLDRARRDGYTAGRANVHVAHGWFWCTGLEILAWRDGHREGYAIYRAVQRGENVESIERAKSRLEQARVRRESYLRFKSA